MCLEELFCPFTRVALNFRQPKIYDTPHSTAVCSGFPLPQSSLRRVTLRSVLHSIILLSYRSCSPEKLSPSNNARTRNVYVALVYLYLFAVALLCRDMLWYSWSAQCWSNLLHWSAPSYALLTCADNTALPWFYIWSDFILDLMIINS